MTDTNVTLTVPAKDLNTVLKGIVLILGAEDSGSVVDSLIESQRFTEAVQSVGRSLGDPVAEEVIDLALRTAIIKGLLSRFKVVEGEADKGQAVAGE